MQNWKIDSCRWPSQENCNEECSPQESDLSTFCCPKQDRAKEKGGSHPIPLRSEQIQASWEPQAQNCSTSLRNCVHSKARRRCHKLFCPPLPASTHLSHVFLKKWKEQRNIQETELWTTNNLDVLPDGYKLLLLFGGAAPHFSHEEGTSYLSPGLPVNHLPCQKPGVGSQAEQQWLRAPLIPVPPAP